MTDNESDDEEIIKNEEQPPGIDSEFRNNVSKVKHIIYEATVLSPELGTKKAQNTGVLGDYIKALNNVNNLSKQAQRGTIDKNKLKQFPEETQEPIHNLLTTIADHSKNNPPAETIPYVDYIQNSYKEHPFIQTNSFNQE
jgi:uncharacterized protein (DUF2225 family)